MKKKYSFIITILGLFIQTANATDVIIGDNISTLTNKSIGDWSIKQDVVITKDASSSDNTVPYGNYYKYSTVQMLYTPSEIGKNGQINSIAFKVATAKSFTTSEVNVYLGHKAGTFSGASDYVSSSNLTLVYSGSPTLGSTTGWETLTFNKNSFTYNGTDNLVVVVTKKSTGYTETLKYACSTENGYTLYRQKDDVTSYADITNTSNAYSTSSNRPFITINITAPAFDYTVPYYNYYNNSTVQTLYTPSEIGKSGKINSIAFKVGAAKSYTTGEVNVYLGHKSTTFSGATDYVRSSNLTLVYSGSPTLGSTTGWETLTFNKNSFTYNGTDNLVVVVTKKSTSYSLDLKYKYFTGNGYTLCRGNDSNTSHADISNTSNTYSTSNNRPCVKISIDGPEYDYNVPYGNYYKNSAVQMLYTPSEIGTSGKVNSIAFKVGTAASLTTSEVNVYLGHKSATFSGASDYVSSSDLTLVYSGSPTLGSTTGWETLTFNKNSFNYNGTDNLVVVVTKKSTSYTSTLKYLCFTGNGYTLYRQNDDATSYADITNTSNTYSISLSRPNIKLYITDSSPVIATTSTNNALIQVARTQGWITSSATQMTQAQAEKVTTIGSAFKNNASITSFSEFKYFTGVTSLTEDAFYNCSKLTSVTLPKSITSINVNSFSGATSLTSILVEANNNYFTSTNGVLYNKGKTMICRYPEGKTGTSFSIPSGVTTVRNKCFLDTKVEELTIPTSVQTIENYAFSSSNLKKINVSWATPPAYSYSTTFLTTVYDNAILMVPSGKVATYQSTNYWNKFTYIADRMPVTTDTDYTYSGVTYTLQADGSATVKGVTVSDSELVIPDKFAYEGYPFMVTTVGASAFSAYRNRSVTLSSNISSINTEAFKYNKALAFIWNTNAYLTVSHITKMKAQAPNVLIYINSTSQLLTSGLRDSANVIVSEIARKVEIKDGYDFYCPKQFTANSISYKRNFAMTTGINGASAGWESIALPFTVQTIKHSTKGQLTPFYNYSSSSTSKPFWLYRWGTSGWSRTGTINGNTPYLICIPNNPAYQDAYNLAGEITFSATSTTVYKSAANKSGYSSSTYSSRQFYPTFMSLTKSSYIYNINTGTATSSATGNKTPGSAFIKNLRDVRPFEGYIYSTTATAPVYDILPFADEATGIIEMGIERSTSRQGETIVYNMKGQLVARVKSDDAEQVLNHLPSGIYIVNGKKTVINH